MTHPNQWIKVELRIEKALMTIYRLDKSTYWATPASADIFLKYDYRKFLGGQCESFFNITPIRQSWIHNPVKHLRSSFSQNYLTIFAKTPSYVWQNSEYDSLTHLFEGQNIDKTPKWKFTSINNIRLCDSITIFCVPIQNMLQECSFSTARRWQRYRGL